MDGWMDGWLDECLVGWDMGGLNPALRANSPFNTERFPRGGRERERENHVNAFNSLSLFLSTLSLSLFLSLSLSLPQFRLRLAGISLPWKLDKDVNEWKCLVEQVY